MVKDITIVSLSRGILGEPFIKHELDLGIKRLEAYGISVRFSKHALMGLDFIEKHPEARAEDLLAAFKSDTDMILCAVGGEDTYRMLPYLFDNNELKNTVSNKIFLGFSDTTFNHLMLYKVGLNTFYGQAFLPDICEIDTEMMPYTRHYFEELITTGMISKIEPSDIWYDSREDFSETAKGTQMPSHKNQGFELLQGSPKFEGEILGGCIDSIFDIFDNIRHADSPEVCKKYDLFPSLKDWKGKILLLETSEEKPTPEKYRRELEALKTTGIFDVISGVLMGKPADETYFDEYKQIIKEVVGKPELSIISNINVGHATPRCIIPFGVHCRVDVERQVIGFL